MHDCSLGIPVPTTLSVYRGIARQGPVLAREICMVGSTLMCQKPFFYSKSMTTYITLCPT